MLIRSEEKLSTADSERITKLSPISSDLNMNIIPKQMELFHSLSIRNSSLFDYYYKVHKILLHFFGLLLFCTSDFTQTIVDVSVINISSGLDNLIFHLLSVPAAAYCSVNDPPANGGVINRTRLRPGSKLFYYCNRGYRLVGSSNATCRLHPNGLFQWDTAAPLCQGEPKCIFVCVYMHINMYIHTHMDVFWRKRIS